MKQIKSTTYLGELAKTRRKAQELTQTELAAATGVGVRLIVDIEKGKPTCQIGKVLEVLHMLGIKLFTEGEV